MNYEANYRTEETQKEEDVAENINREEVRAAAIGVASRRVEISQRDVDRALENANDTARDHRHAINNLREKEAELRVERFTLERLMAGNQ